MKPIAIALLCFLSCAAYAEPTLAGTYEVVRPDKSVNVVSLTLGANGEAVLNHRTGAPSTYTWVVRKDILFLDNAGYYIRWEQTATGWNLNLVPASDGETVIHLKRESCS